MKNKSQIFVSLLLPLAFTVGMLLCFPFRYRFEFDFDEGINLIKAMMTLNGFELYSEVWSDQPPVFNAILTLWFRLLGMKVNAGRILVLGFSTLLLISAMRYLQKFWGIPHAIFGMIAIVTLPFYTTLSVSVMIGPSFQSENGRPKASTHPDRNSSRARLIRIFAADRLIPSRSAIS